jgi:uncharacterized membrane protein
MNGSVSDFRTGVIKPTECIKEGWALIKEQYWLFFGISLVGILIGGLVPIVLMGPMMAGIFLCLFERQRGRPVEFSLLFKGFDYFVPSLIVMLIKMIPIIILMIPYYIFMVGVMFTTMPRGSHPSSDEQAQFLMSFLGVELVFVAVIIVVSILVEIFFMFALPLVPDRKLSGLDAVKLSMKAGKANFGGLLGLMLLNALLGILGVLCCFVGVYFYLPVALAAQAVAYRRVFPEVTIDFDAPRPPPPPASWA